MYKLLIVEDDPGIAEGIKAQSALSKIFETFLPNSANTGRTSFFLI